MVKITDIEKDSRVYGLGVREGDVLISVNGKEIRDVLDYRFYITERKLELLLSRDGERYTVSVTKGTYDDIGLGFETPLMDKKHTCTNKCIFCFVDQMPKGLRDTLYFKDDDSRLSFLHGNYITMTNMKREDIERIIKMRISPINVSVHTTNPELRVKMMKNRFAGEVLSYLPMLAEAGIELCTQLVLCPGINDGEELMRSMHDLVKLCPALISCAAVPVGITKFREGLCPLRSYTPDEAREVIRTVNMFGDYCNKEYGSRIFTAADEFYLCAGLPIPDEDYYEGYPQLENGVGLIRSLKEDLKYYLEDEFEATSECNERVLAVTGYAAYETVCDVSRMLEASVSGLCVDVLRVKNEFFGDTVTVAGLLTGVDMRESILKAKNDKDYTRVVIPHATLKADEDIFLCGMTLSELEDAVGLPVYAAKNEPCALVDAFIK
jgi:putative radical SAM enzyme (TIGR03279 family)